MGIGYFFKASYSDTVSLSISSVVVVTIVPRPMVSLIPDELPDVSGKRISCQYLA
jgi:hypothetical protein